MKTKLLLLLLVSAFTSKATQNYWTEVTLPTTGITCFAVTPDNNTYFAIGTVTGTNGNLYSKTGNGSWTSIPTTSIGFGYAKELFALSSTDVYLIANKSPEQFQRVYKSTDAGVNWKCVDSTLTNYFHYMHKGGNTLYISGPNGGDFLRRSTDNGEHFTYGDTTNYKQFRSFCANGNTIFATTIFNGTYLIKSTDNGTSWSKVPLNGFMGSPYAFTQTPNGTMYLGSSSTVYHTYVSTNNGGIWTQTNNANNEVLFSTAQDHVFGYSSYVGIDFAPNATSTFTTINDPIVVGFNENIVRHFTAETEGTAYILTGGQNGKLYKYTGTVGINELSKNTIFSLYPNPVNDRLYLNYKSATNNVNLYITNSIGEVVLQNTTGFNLDLINTEHLPSGVYFINITNNDRSFTEKFIKE